MTFCGGAVPEVEWALLSPPGSELLQQRPLARFRSALMGAIKLSHQTFGDLFLKFVSDTPPDTFFILNFSLSIPSAASAT